MFVSIGYTTSRGVNLIQIVFAQDYDNTDPSKEKEVELGELTAGMQFVNLAFSQSNAFMGFHGVTSSLGLSINQLGVVYFSCQDPSKLQQGQDQSPAETG